MGVIGVGAGSAATGGVEGIATGAGFTVAGEVALVLAEDEAVPE